MTTVHLVGPHDDPDRYQLTEMRSRGGEGELWAGWVTVDSQQLPVAVKVCHPSPNLPIERLYERARGQAEILRSLDHPNLVKVREVFLGPAVHTPGAVDPRTNALCVVMNWAPGENLASWVARNPVRDPLQCTRIISRIAAGIDEMHSGRSTGGTPVLHRDIKPANIVMDGEAVRLVDFGLARFVTSEYATVAGTPAYLAPEVFAGAAPTEASDRFGLGATAHFLFCGVDPDLTNPAAMRSRLHQVEGISDKEGFSEHVMAMLNPDPARRPSDIIEWSQGLAIGAVSQTFLRPAAPAPTGPQDGSTPDTERKSRRGLAVACAAIVAALVLGGAAFLLLGGEDPIDVAAGDETTTTTERTTTTRKPTTTTSSSTSTSTTTTTTTTISGTTAVIGTQYLADFEPVDYQGSLDSGLGQLSGVTYTRAVMLYPDSWGNDIGFAETDLSRAYTTLSGVIGLRDDVPSAASMKIQIYGDGKVLFDQTVGLGDAIPVELDVTNVLRLRVQVTDLTEGDYSGASIFGDPKLEPK